MPNTILSVRKAWDDGLWLQLMRGAVTSHVPGLRGKVKFATVKTLAFQTIQVSAFGKYTKEDGTGKGAYKRGTVGTDEHVVSIDFDISVKFEIDVIDKADSGNILTFKNILQEHNKNEMIPGFDRTYFSKLCFKDEAGTTASGATVVTGAANSINTAEKLLTAFNKAMVNLTDAGVPKNNRYFYTNPTIFNLFNTLKKGLLKVDSNDQAINTAFGMLDSVTLVEVPTDRLVDKIDYGTMKEAAGAKAINFALVHNPSTFRFIRHRHVKTKLAKDNIISDSDVIARRIVFTCQIYPEREKAVYIHKVA